MKPVCAKRIAIAMRGVVPCRIMSRWDWRLVLNAVLPLRLRADDEADRQALVRQQNKVAALEAQLAGLKVGGTSVVTCVDVW